MDTNTFLKLTRKEQADVIRPLMEAGGSYGSVAVQFGVLRGRIAGVCRDYDIHTTRSVGFEELPKSSSGLVLKLAPSVQTQCIAKDEKGYRCAYLKESDSEYCALPAHQVLEKGRVK